MTKVDPVQALADKQSEWMDLSLEDKASLLQRLLDRVTGTSMETYIDLLGNPDAAMMGYDPETTDEGKCEASTIAFLYVAVVHGAIQKLLQAYTSSSPPRPVHQQENSSEGQQSNAIIIQTFPLAFEDKMGPYGKAQSHVWLQQGSTPAHNNVTADAVSETLQANGKTGAMVVLGAGNHCFLSINDVLHGLFVENSVVFLKHHPLRGHQDAIVRHIFAPLMERGFFATELDVSIERTKEVVYHSAVSKVHLTGGKATHDAIVWGAGSNKLGTPILKAQMTSELGCVTPWILAPQEWTSKELDHQVKHLFASMYSNAGANCNSPKVVLMTKDWPHAKEFVGRLQQEMEQSPLPVAYYPGSKERWDRFRNAYPTLSRTYGNVSTSGRGLSSSATVLPWLVIDTITVDLSTADGRLAAQNEYAFRNEPFAPVVTFVQVDSLSSAVELANTYLFGSLSCTLVAPKSSSPDVEKAISDLKYGSIAINVWSAMCYVPAVNCIWGAYPGETLDNVESGIGSIGNFFFLPKVEKAVLRTNIVDASHPIRKPNLIAATNETKAIGRLVLRPGITTILNLIVASACGRELPRISILDVAASVFRSVQRLFLKSSKPSA